MALAAARMTFTDSHPTLIDVALHEAIPLISGQVQSLQLIIEVENDNSASFEMFGRQNEADDWTKHLSGKVEISSVEPAAPLLPELSGTALSAATLYQEAIDRELLYGPAFQGVEQYWPLNDGVVGALSLPPTAEGHRHDFPPALLDAALQLMLATVPGGKETYLPVKATRIWQRDKYRSEANYRAYVRCEASNNSLKGDLFIYADNQFQMAVLDIEMVALPTSSGKIDELLYQVDWQEAATEISSEVAFATPGQWLILNDSDGLGQQLGQRLSELGETVKEIAIAEEESAVSDTLRELSSDLPLRGIIHLWASSVESPSETSTLLSTLQLIQKIAR